MFITVESDVHYSKSLVKSKLILKCKLGLRAVSNATEMVP